MTSLLTAEFAPADGAWKSEFPEDVAGRTIFGWAKVFFGYCEVTSLPIYDSSVVNYHSTDAEAQGYVDEVVAEWLKAKLA